MMELTIEITSFCPESCPYCSSDASIKGSPLEYQVIKDFLDKQINIDRINISGGEPLSHPRFYEILQYCKSKTKNVWVYTNALTQIKFNSDIVKEIKTEANVCIVPGVHVYIPKNVDKINLLRLVHQGRGETLPHVPIQVSHNFILDCTKNCESCNNLVLLSNGTIANSPCKKDTPLRHSNNSRKEKT